MFQWEITNCEFTAIQDSSHGKRSSKNKCNIYFFSLILSINSYYLSSGATLEITNSGKVVFLFAFAML